LLPFEVVITKVEPLILLSVPVAVLKERRGCAHAVAVAAAEVVDVLEPPEVVEELLPQLASRKRARKRNKKLIAILPDSIFPDIGCICIR
jgi:hypothetical protein